MVKTNPLAGNGYCRTKTDQEMSDFVGGACPTPDMITSQDSGALRQSCSLRIHEEDALLLMDHCSPHLTPVVVDLPSTGRYFRTAYHANLPTSRFHHVWSLQKKRGQDQLPFADHPESARFIKRMYRDFWSTRNDINRWMAFQCIGLLRYGIVVWVQRVSFDAIILRESDGCRELWDIWLLSGESVNATSKFQVWTGQQAWICIFLSFHHVSIAMISNHHKTLFTMSPRYLCEHAASDCFGSTYREVESYVLLYGSTYCREKFPFQSTSWIAIGEFVNFPV